MGICQPDEIEQARVEFKPASKRSCTDILLLLVYLLAWGGFIAILVESASMGGNPYKFIHGVDYANRVCGRDAGVENQPYAAWPYVPLSTSTNEQCSDCASLLVCVADCNETQTSNKMTVRYPSERFVYYCIPSGTTSSGVQVSFSFSGDFESAANMASRAMAAMVTTWPLILASPFVALLFSFLFLMFARKMTGVLVFAAIVLLTIGGVLMAVALLKFAADADKQSETSRRSQALKGLGYTVAVVTALFLCVVIFLRKRIMLAVEVVKESSNAITDMKWMPFFPLFPFIAACAYFVFWIFVALFIFSVAKTETTPVPAPARNCESGNDGCLMSTPALANYTKNTFDQGRQGTFAYSFFHLLWSIQFLVYFTFLVIAGAVGQWYFSLPDPANPDEKKRGDGPDMLAEAPVSASAWRTIRYHLGTIAFGALIIAILQFLRWVVNYIEAKTHAKDGVMSKVQKCVFCLIKCCLRCVECCCDKISKNAFVWTAVYGSSFVPAACSSFQLVWANLARTVALTAVSGYIMFMGKLMVALMSAGICGLIASRVYEDEISSPIMPMVVMFLLSYVTASLFMAIFDTTVDTLFLCFLIDEHVHGKGGLKYASPSLRKIVDDHQGESSEKATEQKRIADSRRAALQGDGNQPLQEGGATTSYGASSSGAVPGMTSAGTSYT